MSTEPAFDATPAAPDVPSDDALMDAIWEKNHGEAPPAEVPEASDGDAAQDDGPSRDEHGRFTAKVDADADDADADAADDADAGDSDAAAMADDRAPRQLPKAIRENWGDLKPEVREAFTAAQDQMNGRLGEALRTQRAIQPIYDKVIEAAQTHPAMANMTPGQIADEVFQLAGWAQRLNSDPVGAIMEVAQMHGVTGHLAQQLGAVGEGEEYGAPAAGQAVMQELQELRQQVATLTDPNHLQTQVMQTVQQAQVEATLSAEVQAFAADKPAFDVLHDQIANEIPSIMDANPDLPHREVLEIAYENAYRRTLQPLISAASGTATKARKAAAAKTAASINVQPEGAGDPPPKTDDELMNEIWDRHYG